MEQFALASIFVFVDQVLKNLSVMQTFPFSSSGVRNICILLSSLSVLYTNLAEIPRKFSWFPLQDRFLEWTSEGGQKVRWKAVYLSLSFFSLFGAVGKRGFARRGPTIQISSQSISGVKSVFRHYTCFLNFFTVTHKIVSHDHSDFSDAYLIF
jgi:hypothetical protein